MALDLPIDIETVKGFMDPEEGAALHDMAKTRAPLGPVMEIGSYCGKSTVYIGMACKAHDSLLYAVDHHRGSEENQKGWEYHDESLYDPETDMLNTLPLFRRTLRQADLEDHVVPLVTKSSVVSKFWSIPLSMVFIDGGHAYELALTDYRCWGPHVMKGGVLAFHDIFEDPSEGGQAPWEVYKLALASGLFEEIKRVKSLRFLVRL